MGFFKRIGQAISGAARSTRSAVSNTARKVTGRAPKEAPPAAPAEAPPAPPAPPTAPPAPPAAPTAPPAPPAEAGLGGEEFGEEQAEAEEGEAEEEAPAREFYPDSITVEMEGDWQISGNRWEGTISGHFSGHMVKVILDLIDEGNLEPVAMMVAPQFDPMMAQALDPYASDIYGVDWY
ncbi:hypothetical protein ACFY2K_42675 [Kitasatospora sp. NPDC001309]|uniref:hypothetical protein n=1 Tax=Kitasatospora sp. NPDC001309 TaxID=3364013 RepID=UPI00369613EC